MDYIITALSVTSIIFLYFVIKKYKTNIKTSTVDKYLKDKCFKHEKQIIIVWEDDSCFEYKEFKKSVLSTYQGSVLIKDINFKEFKSLDINISDTKAPFVLFIDSHYNIHKEDKYMTKKEFYLALGLLRFGNTKAYKVAFNEDTDGRFCQKYEKFKNTPNGYFVDALSGIPLFDTKDRYNSGTGWLSFTSPIEGTVVEIIDPKYGTEMIEIRAKVSGIHLGHVFKDGLNGNLRYCINATVLDFIKHKNI
jgi:peptide methionine sulfoxide reductase msrA/msrB